MSMINIRGIADKLTKKDDQTQQLTDLSLKKNKKWKKKNPNFVFEEEEEGEEKTLRFKRSRRGGIECVFNEGVRPILDFYLSFSASFGWVLREWWIQCGFWLSWGRGSDWLCRLGMERKNGKKKKKNRGNRELEINVKNNN